MPARSNASKILWVAAMVAVLLAVLAHDGHAQSSGVPSIGNYVVTDDTDPAGPVRDFVDISLTGMPLDFDHDVDGRALVPLAQPFFLYGVKLTELVMSTNGYLTSDLEDSGATRQPYSIPRSLNTQSARAAAFLYPYHRDLARTGGGAGHVQFFAAGPLPNASGATEPTTIVQWTRFRLFDRSGSNIDMQVVLFHETGELRFQYRNLTDVPRPNSTVGLQRGDGSIARRYTGTLPNGLGTRRAVSFRPPAAPHLVLINDNDEVTHNGREVLVGPLAVQVRELLTMRVANHGYGTADLDTTAQLLNLDQLSFDALGAFSATTLAVGDEATFTLGLTATDPYPSARLLIASSDGAPLAAFDLSGRYARIQMIIGNSSWMIKSGSTYADPQLEEIVRGTKKVRTFRIRNTGTVPLTLEASPRIVDATSNVDVDGGFFSAQTVVPQSSGGSQMNLAVTPTAAGPFAFTVEIPGNDPGANPFRFTVVGACISMPIASLVAHLGSINNGPLQMTTYAAGGRATQRFCLSNRGTEVLTVHSIRIGGRHPLWFALQPSDESIPLPDSQPLLLAPQQRYEFLVVYTRPNTSETHYATLIVESDGEQGTGLIEGELFADRDSRFCGAVGDAPGRAGMAFAFALLAFTLAVVRRRSRPVQEVGA